MGNLGTSPTANLPYPGGGGRVHVGGPMDKPILCSFLKPNGGRRDEMRYTFNVSKCDCLFDLLL
jgi:hypothetical protein